MVVSLQHRNSVLKAQWPKILLLQECVVIMDASSHNSIVWLCVTRVLEHNYKPCLFKLFKLFKLSIMGQHDWNIMILNCLEIYALNHVVGWVKSLRVEADNVLISKFFWFKIFLSSQLMLLQSISLDTFQRELHTSKCSHLDWRKLKAFHSAVFCAEHKVSIPLT